MADYPTQGLILQNLEQQKDGKNEKDLYNHNAASINTGDYFWGRMRATTFCIGLMPSMGGLTNDSREVFL